MPNSSKISKTVTKRDLVERIAGDLNIPRSQVKAIVQKFLDEISDELASGNRIEFRDFGVFEVRERAARIAQNPRTLERVRVPAKKSVKFKVGRQMQRLVEDNAAEPGEDRGSGGSGGVRKSGNDNDADTAPEVNVRVSLSNKRVKD